MTHLPPLVAPAGQNLINFGRAALIGILRAKSEKVKQIVMFSKFSGPSVTVSAQLIPERTKFDEKKPGIEIRRVLTFNQNSQTKVPVESPHRSSCLSAK